ncbi:MAG: hypothetical protein U9Q07_03345 [Planctomycetota bacterium]|nr:hypothetical protein [Planctomycetota bacterium]
MSSVDLKKRVRDLLGGTYAENSYYGLPDLIANTDDIIDSIYDEAGYSATELVNIKAWYTAQSKFPVLSEYPRLVADLPAVFVFRASDGEQDRGIIGDLLAVEDGDDPDLQTKEVYGSIMDEQIAVHLWAIEASQRDDLYVAIRELILRGRLWFSAVDCMMEWKNGKDGQLYDPQSEPQIIHRAEVSLVCKGSIQWSNTGDKLLDIQSRAINPSTMQGEVDVDPYSEETD